MKIYHLADTHLGYTAYRKITDNGINQRELDIYDAFKQCINNALHDKPDLILHAGDLFDSVRPTNRAITFAMEQLLRLQKANIPLVIISGNHETPRLKETGHIFSIFDHLTNVTLIYRNHYEKHLYAINNQTLAIHAIPQCPSREAFEHQLQHIKTDPQANYNIFLAHGAVADIKEFRMNEFNELMIPLNILTPQFDYIALGHYHKYTKLAPNAYYAGSPERLSFTEAHDTKGYIKLTLTNNITTTFKTINIRTMYDLPPLDCTNKNIETIVTTIKNQLQNITIKDSILRITLNNIPLQLYRALDIPNIRQLSKDAIHFEIKSNTLQTIQSTNTHLNQTISILQEFTNYLHTQNIPNKKTIYKLGLTYLNKIEKNSETT
jgi:DNA repair exonuclease SbcCD nuclease subunit